MKKKWSFYEVEEARIKEISNKYNITELLARILVNREITEEQEIRIFLDPTRNDFYDPFLLPDMEKAVDRIVEAIKRNEKVMIYGDYDVDGITSVTVLKKFLKERGLETGVYIPNRLEEGYGLNQEAINKIIEQEYTLIITVDCGISGISEIEECNKLGIQTIVTDHHEAGEILPNAYAVVDAKRKDNKYPFRELAGVGVVFKLIQAISTKLNLEDKEYLKYLDIVAVGTISDIVPLINENRVIAKLGLMLIKMTKNIGLRELIIAANYKQIDSNTISFGIAPRINACGRMGHQEEALKLFLTDNIVEAKEITNELNRYNLERQEIEGNIYKQALEKLQAEGIENKNAIVLGGDNWYHGVIGIVASKLTESFFKPTVLVCFEGENGKGSGRSIPNFDLYEALSYSGEYLEKFGGHSMAVGLTVKKDNFEKFKEKFDEIAEEKNVKQLLPTIKIDGEISKKELKVEIVEELKKLEPFGEKNQRPIFLYKGLRINSIRALSEGKHLKLSVRDDNQLIDVIGFNLGHLADEFLIGDKIDVVGVLEINEYNGIKKVQINLKDIMKSI